MALNVSADIQATLYIARAIECSSATTRLRELTQDYEIAKDHAKLVYDTAIERATRTYAEGMSTALGELDRRLELLHPDDDDDDDDEDM